MKRTRGLWVSIILVGVLVVASLVGFATGSLQPKLGLDLQGGVSVILQAPQGTPKDVMDQALENIRNRVDAFGVGEPQIAVSGTTIDVQIPGGANGTVEERQKLQYCLVGSEGTNYGCADDQATVQKALGELTIVPVVSQVCLNDPGGKQLACYASQADADIAKGSLTVEPKAAASPSASASAVRLADPGAHRRVRRVLPRRHDRRPAGVLPVPSGRADGAEGPHDRGGPHEVLHHRRRRIERRAVRDADPFGERHAFRGQGQEVADALGERHHRPRSRRHTRSSTRTAPPRCRAASPRRPPPRPP